MKCKTMTLYYSNILQQWLFPINSYRVELLHLLLQHPRDHPQEAPVLQLSGLLVQVAEQGLDCGAFAVHVGVPVHPPVIWIEMQASI